MTTSETITLAVGVAGVISSIWGATIVLSKSWGALGVKIDTLTAVVGEQKRDNSKVHDILFDRISQVDTHVQNVDSRVTRIEAQHEKQA